MSQSGSLILENSFRFNRTQNVLKESNSGNSHSMPLGAIRTNITSMNRLALPSPLGTRYQRIELGVYNLWCPAGSIG